MSVRFATLLLSYLLVVAAVASASSGGERVDRELAAAPADAERLYLPSSVPLLRTIAVAARTERQPRLERRGLGVADARAFADHRRRFDPEPPESHDKRPLPRRAVDDPPQSHERAFFLV